MRLENLFEYIKGNLLFSGFYEKSDSFALHRALVAQLVEHRAVTREVVSSTPAGPTLRVFK